MSLRKSISLSLCLAVFLCALVRLAAAEATPAHQVLSPEERHIALKKIREAQKDIRAITASVTQEKRLASLRKTLVTEGTLVVARPALIRWDVNKPEKTITVLDGRQMTVYTPRTKEAAVYPLSEHAIARNSAAFFATALNGDFDELDRKFNVQVSREGGNIVFTLEPVGIAVRYIASISISYDEGTGLPRAFELITPKGDRIKTTLSRVRTNPALKADTFSLALPSDVRVTNSSEGSARN